MNAILIESQYTGCCGYWNLLLQADSILIDRQEHFVKRSYRNRAHILGANGILRLSIPLESGKHQRAAMKDVRISYRQDWQKLHWESLVSAYRRSPYFEYYEDGFRKLYNEPVEHLIEYNTQWMMAVASLLKITLPISFTEKYYTTDEFTGKDFRSYFMPHKKNGLNLPAYPQVFSDRFEFQEDLSVLDVLFNLGPRSTDYLKNIKS